MSKLPADPIELRNRAMEIYVRDTYQLSFRQNMQAVFPKMTQEEMDALYAECKGYGDFIWDIFKKTLAGDLPFSEADRQIRAQAPGISDNNWEALEGVMARHLLKFSDEGSSNPEAWRQLSSLGKNTLPAPAPAAQPIPASKPAAKKQKPATKTPAEVQHELPLNQALAFVLEWGENFGKPIYERMRRGFPAMGDSEIQVLENEARAIASIAWRAYEEVYANEIPNGEAHRRLKEKFPDISDRNLSSLASQGMYYAWKG